MLGGGAQGGRVAGGGWGEIMKGEKRAGVSWERGLGQVSLREVRRTDEVIGSWEEQEGT